MSRQGQNVGRKDKNQHHPLSRQGQYMGHDKTYCVPDGTPGFSGTSGFYRYSIPMGLFLERICFNVIRLFLTPRLEGMLSSAK